MKLTSEQLRFLVFGYALSQADTLISSMFSQEEITRMSKEQYLNVRICVAKEVLSAMREEKK